ncbi:hypothetical protein Hte_005322 [Hypoxylon texense]
MRPYGKPWVIVNDFREAMDIQTHRTNEFDRAHFLGDIFKPLLPGNHVWMPTGDQFHTNRQLIRDTMSPAFLQQVAGPAIHTSTQGLLALWRQRSRLAQGHPFEAEGDIFRTTVDVILMTTFGFEIGAVKSLAISMSHTDRINLPADIDKPAIFPEVRDPEEFTSVRTLVDSVEIALNSPLPRLSLSFALKFFPSLIKARKYKDEMIGKRLKIAWSKFGERTASDTQIQCAADLLVKREVQMAQKEKRPVHHDTITIRDELFGFLQAGHETGSTTLCWAVKYLTAHQTEQRELRRALKYSYTRAAAANELPSAEEITKTSVPYLDAFIEETHRWGTTSSAIVRVATQDTTILGHRVPKGSDIFFLNNGPSFQTPAFHIDEALRTTTCREAKDRYGVWDQTDIRNFSPRRWLVKDANGEDRFDPHAGPAMPYGTGLRGCFDKKSYVVSPPTTNPPPDGGFGAWLQVFASWVLIFNAWGISITYGDYQAFYESGRLFEGQTSSNISWIGSIQAFLIFAVGALVGPFYDRGYLRLILLAGSFLVVWGHMMLSLCTEYWQVLLAQGFAVGIGGGCLFVPSLAVMQPYFSSNLGLALGIAATGSSVGGVIYPVIFINLIDKVGFAWTTRAIGFVALATLVVPLTFSKMRTKPPGVRSIIDKSAFTDGPYWLCILACFLGYTGCYAAFYYIAYFSEVRGWVSSSLALYLVPILNAASAFGRAVPNWLADKIGPTNVVMPGAFMTGVLLLCNLAVHNAAGIILIAIFLGFFSGVFIATPPMLFIRLTKDKSKVGTRVGMAFAVVGLGVLTGGPGGGAVLQHDVNRLDWTSMWIYAGVASLASGVVFLILRTRLGGIKLVVKV